MSDKVYNTIIDTVSTKTGALRYIRKELGTVSVLIGIFLGMPTLPMAAFMFFELGLYGLVAGYLEYTRRLNMYIALVGAEAIWILQ